DPAERRRLMKFMASPYFNQSRTMTKLCELLLRQIEKGKPGFDRRELWSKLFPGEPYDDVNFRKYTSDLLKLLEVFMAQEVMDQDEIRRQISTYEYVVGHKVEPLYTSVPRNLKADMDKVPYRSVDYYRKQYDVERHYYLMMDFDQKVSTRANIEEISHNLDLYYWVQKLKLHIASLSQKKTGNIEYRLDFIEEILQHLQGHPVEDTPELALYYYSYLTLHEPENTEHYFQLRRLLGQFGALMPQKESIELYDSALHYCIGRGNRGDRPFLQEYFDLFDDALRKGVFIVNNQIALWRFNNVVGAALSINKLDWAEHFVQQYKDYIPAESRENTYTFNLARVYRFQGKYEQVLELLRNVEYEDIGYNLISKMMLTITYYELDAFDTLASFLESFRVFLSRQKNLPQPRRKSYLNLIKFVRRLTRLLPGDKAAVAKLREDVMREKASTVNHEWLLEKIEAL
ncbi:MAG TPA: hypothetical protein PK971_15400, partial [Saprospiraceae bacterium]|nr:hypothetical protein [Saprospiraceae bacterium]